MDEHMEHGPEQSGQDSSARPEPVVEPDVSDAVQEQPMEEEQQLHEGTVQQAPQQPKWNIKKEILDWAVAIVVALVIALIIRTFVFTLVRVDGPSMQPTLHHGDTLYVNRFMYEPEVGDIVIFRPSNSMKTPYVKRVIATEGQVVDINARTHTVTVDGVELQEDYIKEPLLSAGTMQYPFTVPEDHIFVMGDNRNNSRDSRDATVGAVPVKNVIGHALFRLLPLQDFGPLH